MDPFIGEIRMFGGNFAPVGWAFCDGRLLSISEYDALYNLIGTTYGGDGQQSFALPDLRGRTPAQPDAGLALAQSQPSPHSAGAGTATAPGYQVVSFIICLEGIYPSQS